ncbi:MAG TPA: hypothetical protein VL001_03130, partial [Candidimonas sp.]|nr:hypothetical protein [Candidimonas sp.]
MPRETYTRLAKRDGYWRVDGVALINSKEHPGKYVEVDFSRISPEAVAANDPYRTEASKSFLDQSWSVRFGSAALARFRIGSIWHKGKEVNQPERIGSCTVDIEHIQYVRLDEKVTLKGQAFPSVISSDRLCFGGDNRKRLASTLFAVLPVKGDLDDEGRLTHYLVIPASEIFVFYLGSSTRLISAALQGRVSSYIALKQENEKLNKIVRLHVRKQLSNVEAHVLARAQTSELAAEALFGPNKD